MGGIWNSSVSFITTRIEYLLTSWYSGFCSNLIFYRIGRLAWRFQLAAAFVPAVPVLIFVWFCPGKIEWPASSKSLANSNYAESPRWLMKKGRYQEAFHSFCRVRNTELIAARDLVSIFQTFREHQPANQDSTTPTLKS